MNLYKFICERELDYFERIINFYIEISKEQARQIKEDEEKCKKISDTAVDEITGLSTKDRYYDDICDQLYEDDVVRQMLYRSFVVSLCTYIEHNLIELCKKLKIDNNEKFSLQDLGKGSIEKCIQYIKISSSKTFLFNNNLSALVKLRNVLVHDNGHVRSENIDNFLKQFSGSIFKIELDKNDVIFNEESLTLYLNFTKTIIEEISQFWETEDE